MLKILGSEAEIEEATQRLIESGYKTNTRCKPKNWDLSHVVPLLRGDVIDLGCQNSFILENAIARRLEGVKVGIDLADVSVPPGAVFIKGDLTRTGFLSAAFDVVTCLSTIEHGVDVAAFVAEVARLLKPEGHLCVTFDYRDPKIETGVTMFGARWDILARQDVERLLALCALCGLDPVGPLDWRQQEYPLVRGPLQYTFGVVILQKRATT